MVRDTGRVKGAVELMLELLGDIWNRGRDWVQRHREVAQGKMDLAEGKGDRIT